MAALRIRTYGHLHAVAGDLVLVPSADGAVGGADLAEDMAAEPQALDAVPDKGDAEGSVEEAAGDGAKTGRTKSHPKKVAQKSWKC